MRTEARRIALALEDAITGLLLVQPEGSGGIPVQNHGFIIEVIVAEDSDEIEMLLSDGSTWILRPQEYLTAPEKAGRRNYDPRPGRPNPIPAESIITRLKRERTSV